MPYRRAAVPQQLLRGDALTAAMAGIGMRFAAAPAADANIEDTLLAASAEALEHSDLRVLAVLLTWLRVHHPWVNADRLLRAVRDAPLPDTKRLRAFWAAVGRWLATAHKDNRFSRFASLYLGKPLDLLTTGTDFHVRRAGEDPRFAGTPIRVPANVLRDRDADVASPAEVARRHAAYRHRVLMGPTYRADMWAALERQPSLSAADLARLAYGSFATAWHVKHDHALLSG